MIATDKELTKRLWAKTEPRKSLWGHLRETAAVMKGLLTEAFPNDLSLLAGWMNVSREEARQLCQYLAALHDIGKCHPLFQIKEEGMQRYITESPLLSGFPFQANYRHEQDSRSVCRRIWPSKKRFEKWAGRYFSDVLALHHQGKEGTDPEIREGSDFPGADEWIAQQNAIEERAYELFHPPYIDKKQMRHVDAACTVITGLVIMADWLSSSEWFSGDTDAVTDDELDAKVSDVIRRIGLDGSVMPDCHEYAERFPWITAGHARPLQTSVAELLEERADMPLLMILEAPMGEGKTEAGLFAANRMASGWNKKGIYVGLPTAATANQMVGRVDAMLSEIGSDKARLLHSMAWLDEEPLERVSPSDDAHDLAGWLNPSRRALLGQYAVGTVDQAMMAALKVKYGVLRLLGLTGKVLVIDEIHAYDAYMTTVIQRLTEWCMVLRIPVVMMSATLPEHTKRQYLSLYGDPGPLESGYPMVTAAYRDGTIVQRPVTGTFKHGEVGIRLTEDDEAHNVTAEMAVRATVDGGCLCVLVNTVGTAQAIYDRIKAAGTDARLLLFHSRFSAARRQEIENECLTLFGKDHTHRPKKAILVATQVVEQSLDIDFDAMITEIAPIDLLLQRCGRLHRHEDTIRPTALQHPVLDVLLPANGKFGATEKIYHPLFLNRTTDALNRIERIVIPDDIPRLVNEVYQQDLLGEAETEDWMKQLFDADMMTGQAERGELLPPQDDGFGLGGHGQLFLEDGEDSFVAVKTRLGEETVRLAVVPPGLYESAKQCMECGTIPKRIAESLMKHSVSASQRSVRKINWGSHLEGTGRVYGMVILPCSEPADGPTQTLKAVTPTHTIILDREYGLILNEGGTKT